MGTPVGRLPKLKPVKSPGTRSSVSGAYVPQGRKAKYRAVWLQPLTPWHRLSRKGTEMIQIRKASVEDVDTVHSLGESVPEFSVNEETITFWPKGILTQAVVSSDTLILVAEADEQVAGFIIANLNISLRKAIIENVYVRPERRGEGIGSKLLDELLISLKDAGIEYVSTLVPLDAATASRLYIKAGFSKGEPFLWLDKSLSDAFKQ